MVSRRTGPAVLVDGHVHLHGRFRLPEFLRAAASNFRLARRRLGLDEETPGVLAMADIQGQDTLARLQARYPGARSEWQLRPTAEEVSCILGDRRNRAPLVLLAGRQIVTSQDLEVLALGTRAPLVDGLPLSVAVAGAAAAGAITVVPWGFGKWWLRRGRHLRGLLAKSRGDLLYLGDNGGRPRMAVTPRLFRVAAERGIRVLPGSDPLPLASHVGRAGSYGAILEGRLDLERPLAALKELLSESPDQLCTFGERRLLSSFFKDQIAMQWRKRTAEGPA